MGFFKSIGKFFKKVFKVAAKVVPIVLGAAAVIFTAGAALFPSIPLFAGGFGGAVSSLVGKVGLTGTIGNVLTGAITNAGYGAVLGGATSAITGGDPLQGAAMGAAGGAVFGGLGSAISGAPVDPLASLFKPDAAATTATGAQTGGGLAVTDSASSVPQGLAPATQGPATQAVTPSGLAGPATEASSLASPNVANVSGAGAAQGGTNIAGATPIADMGTPVAATRVEPVLASASSTPAPVSTFGAGGWLERNGTLVGGLARGLGQGLLTGMSTNDEADALRDQRLEISRSYDIPADYEYTGDSSFRPKPSARFGTPSTGKARKPRWVYDRERGEMVQTA